MADEESVKPKVIKFNQRNTILTCECSKFQIDILVLTEGTKQKLLEHAKEHGATAISVSNDFTF